MVHAAVLQGFCHFKVGKRLGAHGPFQGLRFRDHCLIRASWLIEVPELIES